MSINQIIADLEAQRTQIDQAISALRNINGLAPAKRRGRPPGSVTNTPTPAKMKRRKMSAAGKARIIAASKKRWAEWRKAHRAE